MGVFKRGEVYYYRFWFNGQLVYESTRQKSKKVAQQLEAEKRIALSRGELGLNDKSAPKFEPAMQEFLDWKKRMTRPNTYRKTKSCSEHLIKAFRNRKLSAISVNDVLDYQTSRSKAMKQASGKPRVKTPYVAKDKVKPATVNRELATLRELCNYWHRQGVRMDNPVSMVKFQEEDTDVFHVLSADEEAKYLKYANQPLKDIAVIMLQTAMRPDEVYTLKKKHVNFQQNYIQIERGKTRAARRRLYMTDAVRAIMEQRARVTGGPYLFPHDTDPQKHMVKVNNGHYGALKRSGLRFRLYDLRHTAATRLAQAGTDLVTLAAILGHSKIQMVLRYAHPVESQKAEAMLKLGEFSTGAVLVAVASNEAK